MRIRKLPAFFGEVVDILVGGARTLVGDIFRFGGSALFEVFSGENFGSKKALGAGANSSIVGGVHGAFIGSGVGIGAA